MVDGKVEISLHCSTATPAAANVTPKRGRKLPDNERRRLRREAWQQRMSARASSATATTAVTTAPGPARSAAAAVTTGPGTAFSAAAVTTAPGMAFSAAALSAVTTAPDPVQLAAMAAATPPQAWALEKREGLVLIARRLRTEPLESPEMVRDSEGCGQLDLSMASWSEDRELDGECSEMVSPLTYAAAAAAAPGVSAPTAEEGAEVEAEPVYRPPPTPPPWSKLFSCHYRRVLCTICFTCNREIWNAKCSDCYRAEREERRK